jgi:tetratricopeptide (TPR) repeat protein
MDARLKFTLLITATAFLGSTKPILSQSPSNSRQLWSACQSGSADERVAGCSAIISAQGFGSQARLADALDARCWAYHSKGLYTAAQSDCLLSIKLRPKYSYAYNNLGAAYLGSKNYGEALAALDVAVDLKPDYFWSRFNRGKALAVLGRRDDALRDLQVALTLSPQNGDVRASIEELIDSLSLR